MPKSAHSIVILALMLLIAPWVEAGPQELSAASANIDPARLYQKFCSACHGDKGNGKSRAQFALDPAPRDFTTAAAWEELTRERMITSVTHGRPGTAMVGWGKRMSEQQITAIVDYVRRSFMHEPVAAVIHPGEAIYKKNCAACHGDKGSGATWTKGGLNPAPRDFTSAQSREELTRERMLTSVTYGRPGTAMMPFSTRLSSAQIETVVDFIRSTFMDSAQGNNDTPVDPLDVAAIHSGPHRDGLPADQGNSSMADKSAAPLVEADMSLPMPAGLHGDIEAGREFFMANCFTCHGKKGDGKGPRASFIHPPPRNFLVSESRRVLNRPALFKAISGGKPGTVMPAWGKVLTDQQIANVAEFVFQTFIQQTQSQTTDLATDTLADTGSQKKKATNTTQAH